MKKYTWYEAIKATEKLGNGWRMPRIEELFSLIDHSRYNPACADPGMKPSYYWSSTTYANFIGSAWSVDFGYGHMGNYKKSLGHYVRPVRDTVNGLEWGTTL
jgi:hypothetical protein